MAAIGNQLVQTYLVPRPMMIDNSVVQRVRREGALVRLVCCWLLKVLFANALIYLQLSNALLPLT